MTVAVEIRDLVVTRGGRRIVDSVSMEIVANEHVFLLGRNGAGKSTLVKAIIRAIRPDSGDISIGGKPLGLATQSEVARAIAYVPQAAPIHFGWTAREIVEMARYPWAGQRRLNEEDRREVEKALERCDCAHLADRPIRELSGGERQCVMIAAALAQHAPILLLDEPTSNLDPLHQETVHKLLREARRDRDLTVLTVTHDLNASIWCDRAIALASGRVIFDGSPKDLMNPEVLGRIYGASFELVRGPGDRMLAVVS